MERFIGRVREIELLNALLKKTSASAMIYGKRKVGKTTLVMNAMKLSNDPVVYYECIRSGIQENISGFVAELVRLKIMPVKLKFDSFVDVFAYLDALGIALNVVIDEYPYLKEIELPASIDSQFQKIIDNHISHIRLFLSGSHIGMMKNMLAESNALYGRFTLILRLTELNYLEASEFYTEKTIYEKIAFFSVFGGSPFVNSFINPGYSLKDNIIDTVLNPNSPVYTYAEQLLISDFAKSANAERIMYAIANGRKKYSEIESALGMNSNGLLSKQIASLSEMEIVSKYYPINKPDDKKKASYELHDNLLRFYYTYIHKNRSALTMLGATAFYDEYIEKSITTFISHRFEEQCRSYFSLLAKSGKLRGVTNIGTFYYDDRSTHTNGEFDVVLERHGTYDIYEVKYYSVPLTAGEMNRESEQVMKIKGLPVGNIGFISASGFEENETGFVQIDGVKLYGE